MRGVAWEESCGDILVDCHLILPPSLALVFSHSHYYTSRLKKKSYCAGVALALHWMQVFHESGPCAPPSEGLEIYPLFLSWALFCSADLKKSKDKL